MQLLFYVSMLLKTTSLGFSYYLATFTVDGRQWYKKNLFYTFLQKKNDTDFSFDLSYIICWMLAILKKLWSNGFYISRITGDVFLWIVYINIKNQFLHKKILKICHFSSFRLKLKLYAILCNENNGSNVIEQTASKMLLVECKVNNRNDKVISFKTDNGMRIYFKLLCYKMINFCCMYSMAKSISLHDVGNTGSVFIYMMMLAFQNCNHQPSSNLKKSKRLGDQ